MKLDAKQEMHLRNLKSADSLWREAKREAYEIAKRDAENTIGGYLADRDRLVRICADAKIPKMQIGRTGLGTSAPIAVYESLQRTEAMNQFTAETTHPLDEFLEWDAEREAVIITVGGGHFVLNRYGDGIEGTGRSLPEGWLDKNMDEFWSFVGSKTGEPTPHDLWKEQRAA